MAIKKIEGDKALHEGTLMKLVYTADGDFACVCPVCAGYALLTEEQAGEGRAQCFGQVILISW